MQESAFGELLHQARHLPFVAPTVLHQLHLCRARVARIKPKYFPGHTGNIFTGFVETLRKLRAKQEEDFMHLLEDRVASGLGYPLNRLG